jgi:hypothetical protein
VADQCVRGLSCVVLVQTIAMILGEKLAPWEDPETSQALLKPLGIFNKAVLGLLKRNPVERTTIPQFQRSCRRVLSHAGQSATPPV